MKYKFHAIKSVLGSDLFLPVILVSVYIGFLVVARGSLPTPDELINTFSNLYARFGYEIIFFAAALECLVLVNFFVPGQIAMAMGAIFASTGQVELTLVVLSATLGSLLGYVLDYVLGLFGFSDILKKLGYREFLEGARAKLKELGNRGLILGFIHPTSGSFLSLAAGMTGVKFITFLIVAASSTIVWLSVWGVLFYMLGESFLAILTRYSFLVVLFIAAGLFILRIWKGRLKQI